MKLDVDDLNLTLKGHCMVEATDLQGWLLRYPPSVAYWVEVLTQAQLELRELERDYDEHFAGAFHAAYQEPEGGKRPSKEAAEMHAAANPLVLTKRAKVDRLTVVVELAKRAISTLDGSKQAVKTVLEARTSELRALGTGEE